MPYATQSIVIVAFERQPSKNLIGQILPLLGLRDGLNQKCRIYEAGLLTVQTDRVVSAEVIAEIEEMEGVNRVAFLPDGKRLYSKERPDHVSTVRVTDTVKVGADRLTLMAGPCAVESEAQACEIAEIVKQAGATILRGGAFKPRTSPYEFGGLGEEGLKYLARAREKTGLPVVTEVLDSSQIDVVAGYADMLQIGSRNMHNSALLFKVGCHSAGKPVLLKRSFYATPDEVLWAAEYVLLGRLCAGYTEPGLVLCERGIRTFDGSMRFTLDVGAIPVLRGMTHCPIIADPSHPAGNRQFVQSLALASVAAGADGLLVEVQQNPIQAWCDGEQCLPYDDFFTLARKARETWRIIRDPSQANRG